MSTRVKIYPLGLAGLNRVKAREALELGDSWVCLNVRAFKGKLEASPGRLAFVTVTLTGRPLRITGWKTDLGAQKINVHTDQKIYSIAPSTGISTDITRSVGGDYTGGLTQPIDIVVSFDHILSVNVGDNPQKWDGVAANASDIGGSPPKAGTITSALTYILLGNLVADVRGVKWSDSGAFEVWATGDAGSLTLYQGPGKVLRLLPLGETVIAYRLGNIHMLFFVGSPFIWGQRQIVADHGLIALNAITTIQGRHVYWGTDNVYIFDGANRVAIADKVIDEMQDSIDPTFQDSIAAFTDIASHEVYFAYAGGGDAGVNKRAWVWNWLTGAWRKEDIEATAAGQWKRTADDSWDSDSGTWDNDITSWDQVAIEGNTPATFVGTNAGLVNFISRSVVDVLGVGRVRTFETGLFNPGHLIFQDANAITTLERFDVEQENIGTHNLEVWIGTQDTLTGDAGIIWTLYTIIADGSKRTITPRKTARYFAIRLQTSGAAEGFRVSGLIAYFGKRGDRK